MMVEEGEGRPHSFHERHQWGDGSSSCWNQYQPTNLVIDDTPDGDVVVNDDGDDVSCLWWLSRSLVVVCTI